MKIIKRIAGFLVITAFAFALFGFVVSPILFFEVRSAHNGEWLPAKIVGKSLDYGRRGCNLGLKVQVLKYNQIYEIRDHFPGDIGSCRKSKVMYSQYQQGQYIEVLKVKFNKYYLGTGNYSDSIIVFFLSFGWFFFYYLYWKYWPDSI